MFSRFGTRLDEETRQRLDRGRLVREALRQPEHDRLSVPEQIAVLLATTSGLLDDVPVDQVSECEATIRRMVREDLALCERIHAGDILNDQDREMLLETISQWLIPFSGP